MEPTTGAIPSLPDYRDGLAGASIPVSDAAAAAVPAEFFTDIKHLSVLDQNKVPACVSHAAAILLKYWRWQEHGELVDFSPRFLDILSSQPWIPQDGGRVPRDVMKVMAKYGCCTTATLPNDTEGLTIAQYRNPNVITQEMRDEAAKYKIPGYVRVGDDTVLDFRTAVMRFGLVSGLFSISDAFWTPSWSSNAIDPLKAKSPTSNHQMVVYGWKDSLNFLRNSWSRAWNMDGDGRYDAKTWLPFVWEGWSIARIPNDAQALISDLPRPEDFHYEWTRDLAAGNTAPDADVKFAQIALMILGLMKPIPADQLGYFGQRTAQAVLQYQALKKIPAEKRNAYRLGPLTRGFLNAEFAV